MESDPRFFMPLGANIPKNWIISNDIYKTVMAFPSWSENGNTHHITMNNETRQLYCDCKGFIFRKYCHHISGLIWCCYKPNRKRGVQDTSIARFRAFSDQELGKRQKEIYDFLRQNGKLSNREISALMPKPINCVTPRIKELRDMGLVGEWGRKWDEITKSTVKVWFTVDSI